MTNKRKNSLKIAAATSVTLFSLFVAFIGSYAWFNGLYNQESESDTMKVIAPDKKFEKMTLHQYLGTSNGKYQFDQEEGGVFTYDWDNKTTTYSGLPISAFMGRYSLYEPRHPFLALIKFSKIYTTDEYDNKINIVASTERNFLGSVDDNGDFIETLDTTDNPLSSIVKFSTNNLTNLTGNTNGTTSYDFNIPSTWDHFVDVSLDNTDQLVINDWNGDKTIVDSSNGEQIQYVAIIFDYYDEAIEYIYNVYLGNEVLEEDTVHFKCDWSMEIE